MVLGRKTEDADNTSLNFSFRITRVDLDDQSSSGSKILFLSPLFFHTIIHLLL